MLIIRDLYRINAVWNFDLNLEFYPVRKEDLTPVMILCDFVL